MEGPLVVPALDGNKSIYMLGSTKENYNLG